jgi:hypothetical protein
VVILEAGVVSSLDYKIISAERADDLFQWLKDNKYSYSGDEATLNHYIQKKWLFTVMKIDTMQMKRNKDGSFDGEVTPTRFQFTSEARLPAQDHADFREGQDRGSSMCKRFTRSISGDMTYQYTWVPMIQAAGLQLSEKCENWIKAIQDQIPALLQRGQNLALLCQCTGPQQQAGRIATTMEWAQTHRGRSQGAAGVSPTRKIPNVDEGLRRLISRIPTGEMPLQR